MQAKINRPDKAILLWFKMLLEMERLVTAFRGISMTRGKDQRGMTRAQSTDARLGDFEKRIYQTESDLRVGLCPTGEKGSLKVAKACHCELPMPGGGMFGGITCHT